SWAISAASAPDAPRASKMAATVNRACTKRMNDSPKESRPILDETKEKCPSPARRGYGIHTSPAKRLRIGLASHPHPAPPMAEREEKRAVPRSFFPLAPGTGERVGVRGSRWWHIG